MITEQLIRKHFVEETMSKGINLIYQTQENVVLTHLNKKSGDLLAHLKRRSFTSQRSGEKIKYVIRIFPYLRYLDIAYRKDKDRISRHLRRNLALYNRVIWGVLYHETFPELRYGFNNEIRNSIRQKLEASLTPEKQNS